MTDYELKRLFMHILPTMAVLTDVMTGDTFVLGVTDTYGHRWVMRSARGCGVSERVRLHYTWLKNRAVIVCVRDVSVSLHQSLDEIQKEIDRALSCI